MNEVSCRGLRHLEFGLQATDFIGHMLWGRQKPVLQHYPEIWWNSDVNMGREPKINPLTDWKLRLWWQQMDRRAPATDCDIITTMLHVLPRQQEWRWLDSSNYIIERLHFPASLRLKLDSWFARCDKSQLGHFAAHRVSHKGKEDDEVTRNQLEVNCYLVQFSMVY